ncbi:MAG: nitrilase family protein [Armatimonadetes bacterium]|nr:nitrilase family protein [Armatimonadota bacterium]
MMRDICVAAVQIEHKNGDKPANRDKIGQFVEEAAQSGAEIVVFPECCITGYWFLRNLSRSRLEELAEPVPEGRSSEFLGELATKYELTVGAGLVEITDDGTMYNTYVVAMPDGEFAYHRKLHCFISEHLSSGHSYTVFDTPHDCRVGLLICYDCNIGENVRINALQGAEILLAPHQTGGVVSKDPDLMGLVDRQLWENRHNNPVAIEAELRGPKGRGWLMRWLPTRAHDNGMFLIFANGVGPDDDEIRTGNSMIIDPYGRILAETSKAGDAMVIAQLDAKLRERATGRRWIRTRRPELYAPLTVPTGEEIDTRTAKMKLRQT